jgi:hypothetical protein
MENGRAARVAETAAIHEPMMIAEGMVETIPATAAPDLLARARAILRAAKQKTVGVRTA